MLISDGEWIQNAIYAINQSSDIQIGSFFFYFFWPSSPPPTTVRYAYAPLITKYVLLPSNQMVGFVWDSSVRNQNELL